MNLRTILSVGSVIAGCGGALVPRSAHATQPLSEFLSQARTKSFDAREQEAIIKQRTLEKDVALGRLLPGVTAQGIYTFNQYAAELPANTFPGQTSPLTITPNNQLDGILQLDVPLVDLGNFKRYSGAKHAVAAAEAQKDVVGTDLDRVVAQYYYVYLGASALLEATQRSVTIAQENLDYVTIRQELGAATELDKERATANLEQTKRDAADAVLLQVRAVRNLETLSGITPTPPGAYPIDDLRKEAPLSEWIEIKDTPQDRVQAELNEVANASAEAAKFTLLPTLSANAQERISNATGFAGQVASFRLQAVLAWHLDYATYSNAQAQAAFADAQKIRAERVRRSVADSIFDAYRRVEAGIAKSAAARAQARAARKTGELSLDRYKAGAVTQLDVTQSQRDAFLAQAASIQADADLAYARILLRISAGKPAQVPASTLPDVLAGSLINPQAPPEPATAPSTSTPAPTPTPTPAKPPSPQVQ